MDGRAFVRRAFLESKMARTHRPSTIAILVVCVFGAPLSGTLLASEQAASSRAPATGEQPASATDLFSGLPSTSERPLFAISDEALTGRAPLGAASLRAWRNTLGVDAANSSFAQRGWRRGGGRGGHNDAAQAEILVGVIASVTGAAILVYSHRPECSNPAASGCGYGTRVVGGAVLSAGVLSLVIGALTWR
jgi:hypothetical protein